MTLYPDFTAIMAQTALLLSSYLIGGIPTSYLLTQWLCNTDIRRHGSGNSGATNASRLLGKKFFFIILAFDAGKAYGAIALVRWLYAHTAFFHDLTPYLAPEVVLWCAAAVLIGNSFSPFLDFHGGKGVATGAGLLCAFLPAACVLSYALIFIVMMAISWRVDVSALMAVLCGALLTCEYLPLSPSLTIAVFALAAWIWLRHWQNILYLLGIKHEF